jgi:pyridoxamine 5'-phosphate oxidase
MTHLSCQDLIDIAAVKVRLETPQEICHQIWKELGRATHDRHHAWRTPVLATVSSEGDANARTVVLRSVDSQLNQLQIYTDSRSSKAVELTANPSALFVFWSPRLSWQLRVRTTVTLVKSGDQVEQLWSQV